MWTVECYLLILYDRTSGSTWKCCTLYFNFATCIVARFSLQLAYLNEASMIYLALTNFLQPKCGPWGVAANFNTSGPRPVWQADVSVDN